MSVVTVKTNKRCFNFITSAGIQVHKKKLKKFKKARNFWKKNLNIWSDFLLKSIPNRKFSFFSRWQFESKKQKWKKKNVSTACNELNISVLVLWRRSTDFITPSFYVATIYFIFIHAEDIGLFRFFLYLVTYRIV